MPFDIQKIQRELSAAPLPSPYPLDVAIAIVNDCFRMAGKVPVDDDTWIGWACDMHKLWSEQLGALAHLLAATSMRVETVAALTKADDRRSELPRFFAAVEPLTAEMVRSNAFRQEEFIRHWIRCCAGTIAKETGKASKARLDQLDYRKTLEEYRRAEAARKAEEARRQKLLEEARQREAAARGWRE